MTRLPRSGLLTVKVPVTETIPPTGMLPVQVIAVGLSTRLPEVAVWSPVTVASSIVSALGLEMVIPV